MKLQPCLKLGALGAFAFGAIAAIHQSAAACPANASTPTCPHSNARPTTVVPPHPVSTTPVSYPPIPMECMEEEMVCQPAAIAPPPPVISDSFFCQPDHWGRPTTFIATPTGIYPLINWVSHYFSRSGFDPEVRCQEVSNRFDRYYREGRLNYITTGIINRQPVVCVATEIGGPCTGLLFTLKPNENASQVIQQLFNVRASIPGSLYVSESRQYLDVRRYIQAAKTPQL